MDINNLIREKIFLIESIIQLIKNEDKRKELGVEMSGIKIKFLLSAIKFMDNNEKENNLRYKNSLISDGVFSSLSSIFEKIFGIVSISKIKNKKIQSELKKMRLGEFHKESNDQICKFCNIKMTINKELSEVVCKICGNIEPVICIFSDDSQRNQEGRKSKVNHHYNYWIKHIMAREDIEEIGGVDELKKITNMLIQIMDRDNITIKGLNIEDIRVMLKEIKRTDLNKNIPFIFKSITGICPPELSEKISTDLENMFVEIVEAKSQSSDTPCGKRFGNYYPYYIYKILELIIPEKHQCRKILFYIHFQDIKTIEKCDSEWKKICKERGLKFIETHRFAYRDLSAFCS